MEDARASAARKALAAERDVGPDRLHARGSATPWTSVLRPLELVGPA
jgi:hypothetical protein